MSKEYSNFDAVKEFISVHNLMNNFSEIDFYSMVVISTSENKFTNNKMKVKIRFNQIGSLGVVEFFDKDLNPQLYPEQSDITYGKIEHIKFSYLKITGTFKSNPKIGEYVVTIQPL